MNNTANKVKKNNMWWKMVEENKWARQISSKNYLFVIINPLGDDKYKLTYMDANIDHYDEEEQLMVRSKYNIARHRYRLLDLRLMEDFEHYEWQETLNSKDELINVLSNETSFELSMLKNLKE